jgi:probable F420-dependent oxidoreductase
MKFGLMFTNTGMGSTPAGARQLATAAEGAGFESLWTVEHVVVPSGYESKYPYDKSGKMAGGAEEFDLPDPLIWLAYIAGVTERIKLGTGILILPQRNPLVTAKEVATLDVFSGGRLLLGVGVGWLQEEFDALGVPFADRGRRHDDYVEAMRALWTGEKASVHNTYANFDRCITRPVPVNGSVPIVIGGHTTRAAQRAARIGNGFFPGSGSIEDLSAAFESMRAECAAIGRDPGEIELTASGGGRTFDEVSARIEQLGEMGVTRVMLSPLPGDRLLELAAALQDRFGMDG